MQKLLIQALGTVLPCILMCHFYFGHGLAAQGVGFQGSCHLSLPGEMFLGLA